MPKASFLVSLLVLTFPFLEGQVSFPEVVAAGFGSDQELINGIQFSNHYGQIEGHPYFLDGRFRSGSVLVNNQKYEQVKLRYNLYSQKVEIEYRTAEGHLNQFMSVAELMPSFSLEGLEFRRMQFPDKPAGYYQVISSGKGACYIGWKKEMRLTQNRSSGAYEFTLSKTQYWLRLDQQVTSFHNRKSFIAAFPGHRQKEISMLLKKWEFTFRQPSVQKVEAMIKDALRLYEKDNLP